MNKIQKLFLLVMAMGTIGHGSLFADTAWNGTYNIPNDGETYYVSTNLGTLENNITISGILEIRSGGTVTFGSGFGSSVVTINTGASVRTLTGGTLNIGTSSFYQGVINQTGGEFKLAGGTVNGYYSSHTISGGTFNLESGTYNVSPSTKNFTLTMTGGTLNLGGATLNLINTSGTVNIFGINRTGTGSTVAYINSGALSIGTSETMTIPSNSSITINSPGSIQCSGSIINGGTTTNSNSFTISVPGVLVNNGIFNNYKTFSTFGVTSFTNNGIFNNYDYHFSSNTTNNGTITNHGSYTGSITNTSGVFFHLYNSTYSGTITGGTVYDWSSTTPSIPENQTAQIPPGVTITIYQPQRLSVLGTLQNNSNTTFNILGNLQVYNTLENGDGPNAGTINVNYPGELYLMGGELINKNAGSAININSGGSLYNYYGTLNTTLGNMTVDTGGQFHNVRGGIITGEHLTLNAGTEYHDSNVIMLDKNLDIDYTLTITGKAVISGLAYDIIFGENGGILIDHNASLLLEDVICKNVSGFKIRCLDNTGTLSINNSAWSLDGNYSFTQGTFYTMDNWTILGNENTFTYSSPIKSTVASKATLIMKNGILNYRSENDNELIEFELPDARLHLDRGELLATWPWKISQAKLLTTGTTILKAEQGMTLDMTELSEIDMHVAATRIGNTLLDTAIFV